MIGAVKVSLNPDRLALSPGEAGDVEVTISNTSQAVEHYRTTIVGLPEEYSQCQPDVVKLRPGESSTVQVRTTLPEKAGPDSGLYTLGVLVRSPYQRQVSRCEELRMDILPAPALSVDAQPEVGLGGSSATFDLTVTNQGNTPLTVALTGNDRENQVDFTFRPRSLELRPGESAPARLVARGPVPWTGQEARRTLTVRASAPPDLSAERTLSFVQRVRLRGGLLRTVGMAAGVAVLAGATFGGALVVRNAFKGVLPSFLGGQQAAQTQPATTPTAAPATGQPTPPTASAPANGPASTPPSAAAPGGQTLIDFSKMPDGSAIEDQVLATSLYADKGVTLSADVDQAPLPCQNAKYVALRNVRGIGGFLTSASLAGPDTCNSQPVRITFAKPVHDIGVTFAGTGKDYVLTVVPVTGAPLSATVHSVKGQVATVRPTLPPTTKLKAVVFGPAVIGVPGADNVVYLKRVAFIPAS
jgi:hypothetical protein